MVFSSDIAFLIFKREDLSASTLTQKVTMMTLRTSWVAHKASMPAQKVPSLAQKAPSMSLPDVWSNLKSVIDGEKSSTRGTFHADCGAKSRIGGTFRPQVDHESGIAGASSVAVGAKSRADERFHPPLDISDGAARIVDPIISGFNAIDCFWGLLKDYKPTDW